MVGRCTTSYYLLAGQECVCDALFFGRIRDNPTTTIYWRMSIPIRNSNKNLCSSAWMKENIWNPHLIYFVVLASLNCLIEFLCYILPAFSVRMRPLQMKIGWRKVKTCWFCILVSHSTSALSKHATFANENWMNKNVKTCWFGLAQWAKMVSAWHFSKPKEHLVSDWVDSLIDPGELLLLVFHLFANTQWGQG